MHAKYERVYRILCGPCRKFCLYFAISNKNDKREENHRRHMDAHQTIGTNSNGSKEEITGNLRRGTVDDYSVVTITPTNTNSPPDNRRQSLTVQSQLGNNRRYSTTTTLAGGNASPPSIIQEVSEPEEPYPDTT